MLLKCPHCDDEANIPNALSQYGNMPIACHACGGFFFAPPPDPDDLAFPRDDDIARPNQQIKCAECDIPVLIPHIDAAGARHRFSCPACHAELPVSAPDLIAAPDILGGKPKAKSRSSNTNSLLAIFIAIGIGVGVALSVLLSKKMIALDTANLGEIINQTSQTLNHLWHQTLAALSLG